ncbi:P-loop containing nucleoside triphosphate hydrolase protein [Suillus clintonianus]|uniref:P-loop containing nucleoside triphosphate hydrolase protein n=1 Tax=Suillus clintonianus TaxID=1904413 RepID=UPI001B86BD48|nr:P-loop containing nucleoside triphosphate hydrolase protein [Suillus clintonianus]KAG2152904.1 P-loop containing nucleoside triphosphate hydrolase protein [Suillus clintonianus]
MVAAGSITVAVRVRPPTTWEAGRLPEPSYDTTIRGDGTLATPGRPVTQSAPLRDIVQIVDDRILTFDPEERDKTRAFVERGFVPPGTKRYKDKRFMFDRVFDSGARQVDVYEATAKPLLNGLLDGYNATVFAYGATGCGKTHTISGTEADPGIIYLTMADLFQRIEDRKDDWNIEVVATFLEIYNEEIRDLLSEPGVPTPRGGLQIREDKSVKVVGLVELRPTSAEEVKQIVLQGNSRRTQSPTHANETSSRSHAVLQVHVTQAPRTASLTEQRTMATLSIIDLAGSERAAATSNMGQRMVEGANINKSLLALGNCINALCESGGAIRHVPYRNSKLTRLLKFSLGGNCKTVMVVCVAPTSQHFDDTHNTLLYAERATKIKTKVVTRNVVNVDRHVGQYVEAINRLNLEVAELKSKLAGKLGAENDILKRKRAEAAAEVDRSKRDMQDKMEQTQASIVEGASCAGKISVAEMKLAIIRSRLAEIDVMASFPLSSDLEAERALLKSLARLEESVTTPDSPLVTRLTRSQNSRNMFEATLRAVSERRSDKLEELHIDCIKTDARCRKAEVERVRAERERDAVRESVGAQSEMIISLLGMVGRCTVVLGETARSLEAQHGFEGMASALRGAAQKNDDALAALVGQTTAAYAAQGTSALDAFRVPSGSALPQPVKASRKSMSYNAIASSPWRTHKSPRRSLRSSIGQPYRRVSDKEKEKKVVQWKDEAGQGALDDRGNSPSPPVILVTSSDSSESVNGRSHSVAGSESEWEDERTEDSLNMSNIILPASSSSSSARFNSSMSLQSSTSKRPRASRLDPSFLKLKGASSLGCLQEADEDSPMRRAPPLSDRSMNRQDTETLHIPKYRERDASPTRRQPTSTPRTTTQSKSSRRRSNIGPMRSEKARRRSSMISQPSEDPPLHESMSGPRRTETIGRSPAKRPKRLSLLANASRSLRVKGPNVMATLPLPSSDVSANISADLSVLPDSSMRVSSKPTWR